MEKIAFYLMNEKGYFVLIQFLKEYHPECIKYVVLAKDKNIEKDYFEEIKNLCKKYSIEHYEKSEIIEKFSGYKIAIGWRWIIEDNKNLIVLHDSILPHYRGFSPLVNMLINGEKEIGVTALLACKEYDKGDILGQEKIEIIYPIKIQKAIQIISKLYYKLVNTLSKKIINGEEIIGFTQDEDNATYSLWRDEQDYYIDWNVDSKSIRRKVDATGYPYTGAKTYINNKLIIIDEVEEYPDVRIENRDIGKVIFIKEGYPIVVCKQGLIKIKKARTLNGKSVLPLKNFRNRFGDKIK